MAKCIKLTDEVYQDLRDLARADGETIAGEIRKTIALRKIVDDVTLLEQIVSRLEQAVDRLEAVPPAPEKLKPTKKSELSGVNWDEIARGMHRDK